jgi:hypothetical protein
MQMRLLCHEQKLEAHLIVLFLYGLGVRGAESAAKRPGFCSSEIPRAGPGFSLSPGSTQYLWEFCSVSFALASEIQAYVDLAGRSLV